MEFRKTGIRHKQRIRRNISADTALIGDIYEIAPMVSKDTIVAELQTLFSIGVQAHWSERNDVICNKQVRVELTAYSSRKGAGTELRLIPNNGVVAD
jgi:hypothetical protein